MFGIGFDVLTPKRLQERVEMGDWFLRDVVEEGKVLYESRDPEWVTKAEGILQPRVANYVRVEP